MISLLNTGLKVMRKCLFKLNLAKMWFKGLHYTSVVLKQGRKETNNHQKEHYFLYAMKIDFN